MKAKDPLRSLPTVDVRSFPCEVRMTTSPAGRKVVEGYAAVFNSRSQVLRDDDGEPFVEQIRPGAFTRSLVEADVRGLYNHDTRYLLGRRGAGTLRLSEDSKGLAYEVELADRSYDRDLEISLERKDVFGSSFSFATVEDEWTEGPDGVVVRELRAVHLFDVGPVVFPAYLLASASIRSHKQFLEQRSAKAAPPPAVEYPTPEQRALLREFASAGF